MTRGSHHSELDMTELKISIEPRWKGRPVRESPHCKVRISSNPAKLVANAKTIALAWSIRLSTIEQSGPRGNAEIVQGESVHSNGHNFDS